MINWVKNILSAIMPMSVGQGAETFEKKAKAKLIDVTEGVSLTEEARKRSLDLLSTIRKGGDSLDRLRLWLSVRRKTKKGLADFYDMPEIMDEVTEKILEAAEFDPFYRRMFR